MSTRAFTSAMSLLMFLASVDGAHAIPAPPPLQVLRAPVLAEEGCTIQRERWALDCRGVAETEACEVRVEIELVGFCALEVGVLGTPTLNGVAWPVLDGAERVDLPVGPHTVGFAKPVRVTKDQRRGWDIPADETRHLLLHSGRVTGSYALGFRRSPGVLRGEGYSAEVAVSVGTEVVWEGASFMQGVLWAREGGQHVVRLGEIVATDGERYPDLAEVLVAVRDPGELVHHAGPQLSLGVGLHERGESFRVRLEYEVAIDDFILPGFGLDADTRTGWWFVPRVEIATPFLILLPSLSVGVGVPIELGPEPEVGLRLLAGMQYGPLGLVGSVDLFPGGGRAAEGAVLFKLSL